MDITKFVQNKIEQWDKGTVNIIDGLPFNASDMIKTIVFYTESKYLSGNKDRRGKDKPFYNIVNFRVNVATRATDIDTKDINIVADEPQHVGTSFILQKEVYNWMKETNFAKTLNEMGSTRAKFGGVLVKRCIEDDEIKIDVVDWRNVIVDPTDPDELVIEKHFMSDAELSEKEEVWEGVREAMDLARKSPDGKLEVLEVTGYLPESFSPNGGDEYKFSDQKFFIYMKDKKKAILYHEFLKEEQYKYLPWEKINGRLGRGIVEDGFEAQKWTNDAVIKAKEAMELGSKVIFTTTDQTLQNNILTDVENGQIIKRTAGTEFSLANTITNALPEFNRTMQEWDSQLERTTSTFNAITGETMPSATAFRSVAIQNQEATSMFDYRREEMGIFLVEIFTDWIIPFLIKKLNKAHILAAEFSAEELQALDENYATFKANETVNKLIENGKVVYAEDYKKLVEAEKQLLQQGKQVRFLDIPKGFYGNWKPRVTIVTTGEQKNKAVILESLNNVLLTIAKAPQILQDPVMSKVFSKILEVSGTGISPITLGLGQTQTQPMQLPEQVAPTTPENVGQTASQTMQQ